MECVPNMKLIAKVNREFSAWSRWANRSLVFLRFVGREVVASAGYIERWMENLIINEAETNWFFSVSDSKTDKTQENVFV